MDCDKKESRAYAHSLDDIASTAASSTMASPIRMLRQLTPTLPSMLPSLSQTSDTDEARKVRVRQRIEALVSHEDYGHGHTPKAVIPNPFGWISLCDILSLPDFKTFMQHIVTHEQAVEALHHSEVVQLSGDGKRIRTRNSARKAVALLPTAAQLLADESSKPVEIVLQPPLDFENVADEDLTVAFHIEPAMHVSGKKGAKSKKYDDEILSRPFEGEAKPRLRPAAIAQSAAGHHRVHAQKMGLSSYDWVTCEMEYSNNSDMAAWVRLSDDAFPSPAANTLQW